MNSIVPTDEKVPVFIPEWSVWDRVITYHYETASTPAKDFMYELVQLNVDRPVKLSVIPYELKVALDAAFGGRHSFDFLLEHGASIETLPPLLAKTFNGNVHHALAVVLLGFWKSLNFSEVYIVTEDAKFKDGLEETLNKMGINFSHMMIVNPKEALDILKKKCK